MPLTATRVKGWTVGASRWGRRSSTVSSMPKASGRCGGRATRRYRLNIAYVHKFKRFTLKTVNVKNVSIRYGGNHQRRRQRRRTRSPSVARSPQHPATTDFSIDRRRRMNGWRPGSGPRGRPNKSAQMAQVSLNVLICRAKPVRSRAGGPSAIDVFSRWWRARCITGRASVSPTPPRLVPP